MLELVCFCWLSASRCAVHLSAAPRYCGLLIYLHWHSCSLYLYNLSFVHFNCIYAYIFSSFSFCGFTSFYFFFSIFSRLFISISHLLNYVTVVCAYKWNFHPALARIFHLNSGLPQCPPFTPWPDDLSKTLNTIIFSRKCLLFLIGLLIVKRNRSTLVHLLLWSIFIISSDWLYFFLSAHNKSYWV